MCWSMSMTADYIGDRIVSIAVNQYRTALEAGESTQRRSPRRALVTGQVLRSPAATPHASVFTHGAHHSAQTRWTLRCALGQVRVCTVDVPRSGLFMNTLSRVD